MDQKEVKEAVKAAKNPKKKKIISEQSAPIANRVQKLMEKKKKKEKKQ